MIAFGRRALVDLYRFTLQVYHPNLKDAPAGVERNLNFPVIIGRSLRYFNDEQDVLRPGMGRGIKIRAWSLQCQVWLGLGMLPQTDGVLDADYGSPPDVVRKKPSKPVYSGSMPASNRSHFCYLPFDEFHTVILAEDAGPNHGVIFLNCEQTSRHLNSHASAFSPFTPRLYHPSPLCQAF
jgi:hypothetical protein